MTANHAALFTIHALVSQGAQEDLTDYEQYLLRLPLDLMSDINISTKETFCTVLLGQ